MAPELQRGHKFHNGAGWRLSLFAKISFQSPRERIQWEATDARSKWQTVPHWDS